MKVLVTRPAAAGAGTAARLTALGHEPIFAPCLTISARSAELPAQPGAIILTSAQAVPALPEAYRGLPAFCVGDATARRLRQAGFAKVSSAAGDADALFRLVTEHRVSGAHLLAVGARQGQALARCLRGAGIMVERRVVYEAAPAAALPAPALAALGRAEIGAALFYSPETARAFIRLAPPRADAVTAYALSPRIATALAGLPWRAIHVSVAPNERDLLALLHE